VRLKPRHNAEFVLGDGEWFGSQDFVWSMPLSQSRLKGMHKDLGGGWDGRGIFGNFTE